MTEATVSKASPGPWKIDEAEADEHGVRVKSLVVVDANGEWIAALVPHDDEAVELADALIIAAAPAMYRILGLVAEMLRNGDLYHAAGVNSTIEREISDVLAAVPS